jgi:phenylacetate-CoA ligase
MALEDLLHPLLGRYMQAAPPLREGAAHLYRLLPNRVKYGHRYRQFEEEASLGLDGVNPARVELKLAQTLAIACRAVPALRAWRHIGDDPRPAFERLRELPLRSKLDIKADLQSHLVEGAPIGRAMKTFTGGSTTNPMLFFLERSTSRPRETAYTHWIERHLLNRRAGDWVLSLRGRTVSGAARADGDWVMLEPIRRHLILSSDHLEPRYMPRYVDALRRWRPRLIHAFPSALYPLARWLQAHPCPEFTDGVRGILLTSENVYDFQLELLSRLFSCPIVSHYGHSERVLMGQSEAPGTPYSFWPLYGWLELVDTDGQPIDDVGKVGEIVGTSFDNGVMPFVRYRTGDLGAWAETPVAGRAPRLARIEGRLQEFVVCADHRLVSITTLGAAHFSELSAADAIQFHQDTPGLIELHLVARRPLLPREIDAVAAAVRAKTQGGCEVRVVETTTLHRTPRGKTPLLVQRIDLGRYFGSGRAADLAPDAIADCTASPTNLAEAAG